VYLTINCKCCGVYPRWATLLWKCKNNLTGFKHWHDTPSGKFQTSTVIHARNYLKHCTKLPSVNEVHVKHNIMFRFGAHLKIDCSVSANFPKSSMSWAFSGPTHFE
jgi:hypothetical protein